MNYLMIIPSQFSSSSHSLYLLLSSYAPKPQCYFSSPNPDHTVGYLITLHVSSLHHNTRLTWIRIEFNVLILLKGKSLEKWNSASIHLTVKCFIDYRCGM